MKHLRYLRYVLRHKWFVFIGCLHLRVSLWQAIIHDWTKFTPIEWRGYVERMALAKNSTWHGVDDTPAYAAAWEHHWSHNPHHWEYWLRPINLDCPDTYLSIGDYVTGAYDNLPLAGYVVDRRISRGTPHSNYKIRTATDCFWAANFEITTLVLPMPERYVREMVADWYGAGMAQGKPDIRHWHETTLWRKKLHPDTLALVEDLIGFLPNA
jgi:hypothetical protein